MKTSNTHTSHPDIIKRLKRASGHLNKVIIMIEEERSCPILAQQLYAVEKAIYNAKQVLIHDHINHCLDHSYEKDSKNLKEMIEEFKKISKFL